MNSNLNTAPHRWIATKFVEGDATLLVDERITNYLFSEGLAKIGDNVCVLGIASNKGFVLTEILVSNARIAQSQVMDIAWKFDYDYPEVLACDVWAKCMLHRNAVIRPYNTTGNMIYIT